MQCILGLDLSTQPCEITVSRIDAGLIEVLQRRSVEIPLLSDTSLLHKDEFVRLLPKPDSESEQPGPNGAVTGEEQSETETVAQAVQSRVSGAITTLREAIGGLEPVWSAAVVIMPPQKCISLNLNLPFGDAKNLNRIVDLEVQDVVPFDLDEFLVQYSTLGPMVQTNGAAGVSPETKLSFDVHVGVMPRTFVRNVLQMCKTAGVEPSVLTIPSSALGAVFHLAKDYFKSNTALILIRGTEHSLTIFMNGEVRVEHTIDASQIGGRAASGGEEQTKAVFTALKLAIAAAERRYESRVDTIYVLGRQVRTAQAQQLLGRPIEGMQIRDVVKTVDPDVGISALGPIFATDDSPAPILSNFRAREFSYSPRFGEVVRALQAVSRYVGGAVAALVILFAGLYAAREYNISRSKDALVQQIRIVIPEFDPPDGNVREGLLQAESKLSEDLGVLGSPAKVTPLDALIEIVQRIPESSGVTVQSIKISGTRAVVSGIAPEISAIERVQKELKSAKGHFKDVKANPGAAMGSKYNFTIEIILSQ